ncbi:hypothetical protein [Myxosarcina sp. GI1(2024)]
MRKYPCLLYIIKNCCCSKLGDRRRASIELGSIASLWQQFSLVKIGFPDLGDAKQLQIKDNCDRKRFL